MDSYGDGWHGGYITVGSMEYCRDFNDGILATSMITAPENEFQAIGFNQDSPLSNDDPEMFNDDPEMGEEDIVDGMCACAAKYGFCKAGATCTDLFQIQNDDACASYTIKGVCGRVVSIDLPYIDFCPQCEKQKEVVANMCRCAKDYGMCTEGKVCLDMLDVEDIQCRTYLKKGVCGKIFPHDLTYEEGCTEECGEDIDCVGSWDTCNASCDDAAYVVTTANSGNGAQCDTAHGDKRKCAPGEGDCPEEDVACGKEQKGAPKGRLKASGGKTGDVCECLTMCKGKYSELSGKPMTAVVVQHAKNKCVCFFGKLNGNKRKVKLSKKGKFTSILL